MGSDKAVVIGSLLCEAIASDRTDKDLQELLATKAQVNVCNEEGELPLLVAIGTGRTATVRALLVAGADANCADTFDNLPLTEAVYMGVESLVAMLLRAKADAAKE